jgi:glycogen synthase
MTLQNADFVFQTKIESWLPLRSAYQRVFTAAETEIILEALRGIDSRRRRIVFLTFENHYAALGGLATITRHFPRHLQECGERVLMVTPFHPNHTGIQKALDSGALLRGGGFRLLVEGSRRAAAWFVEPAAKVPTYYLSIDGFFTAGRHPYDYNDGESLLRDALAFSSAVPVLMTKLKIRQDIVFHANDWETALVALTAKCACATGQLKSAATILTLHNSFDHPLPPEPALCFTGRPLPNPMTVLQHAIPFLDGPLVTVSAPFAHELRHDPLQRDLFGPHLQTVFSRNSPVGIGHGLFGESQPFVDTKAMRAARTGDYRAVVAKKLQWRTQLCELLAADSDTRSIGKLTFRKRGTAAPIFFMSGRMDMGQKGFDVMFQAFRQLPPGTAKLIFSPSNPHEGSNGLDFFRDISRVCRGDITIWPFYVSAQLYRSVLKGSSFLLMPSLYEPFGAATEGLINGTPVIARATGGLWSQVTSAVPCHIPGFYRGMIEQKNTQPTGILYRERCERQDAGAQWRRIITTPAGDRMRVPLYRTMTAAALRTLQSAITIYHDSNWYAALIANGFDKEREFNWPTAVEKYRQIYNLVGLRGSL